MLSVSRASARFGFPARALPLCTLALSGARPTVCAVAACLVQETARHALRRLLEAAGVPNAGAYRTHDLKRGHNEDMVQDGKGLTEISVATGWHGPGAMRSYTDLVSLEMRACLEAHRALLSECD